MWASRCISLHLQGLKPYIIFVQGSNVMRSVYNKTIICHSRVIVVTIYANLQSSLNQFQPQICSFFAAEFYVTTLFRVIFCLCAILIIIICMTFVPQGIMQFEITKSVPLITLVKRKIKHKSYAFIQCETV